MERTMALSRNAAGLQILASSQEPLLLEGDWKNFLVMLLSGREIHFIAALVPGVFVPEHEPSLHPDGDNRKESLLNIPGT